MRQVLIKIYADFTPADATCRDAVAKAGESALGCDEPWLFLEKGMLRISFEGIYFPLDDVLHALTGSLPANATGKLDQLDLEAWLLTRHILTRGAFQIASRSLNQVLEYSGH